MYSQRGFTLLEMVVVLVMMGITTALVMPGLQKMYDSMAASLARKELVAAFGHLALDVRSTGRSLEFKSYPADAAFLPPAFVEKLAELNVSFELDETLFITAAGFCPDARIVAVKKDTREYLLQLRSPDCRVVQE